LGGALVALPSEETESHEVSDDGFAVVLHDREALAELRMPSFA
jgi:hypothetical protein